MRILIDMDGVLVDLMHGWLPWLNQRSGLDLTPDDIDVWGLEKVYPLPFSTIRKPLHRKGFWEGLPPYEGAINFVDVLDTMGHEVYIVTAPFPSDVCMWGKKTWFEHYLDFLPPTRLVITHDKHIIRGDMLIDDKPENLLQFRGDRVLFNQPWNINLKTGIMESWFIRVYGYSDILALLGKPY